MTIFSRLRLALKAVKELGLQQVSLFGLYRLGLFSGHYRRSSPHLPLDTPEKALSFISLPSQSELEQVLGEEKKHVLQEAGEVVAGLYRPFGGAPVHLEFIHKSPLLHWTFYETGRVKPALEDVKFIWEPARFGWAFCLARAYQLNGDENYPQVFWNNFEEFCEQNPPFLGPNWISAQEVALRLIALVFSYQVFAHSPYSTESRQERLRSAVAEHAARIPSTMVYAHSQNNNHLISEAAGLLTAGLFLQDYPASAIWATLGWNWFNKAIQTQIDTSGIYVQHSMNYHRLMLHLALWVDLITRKTSTQLPQPTRDKLASAVLWLVAQVDPVFGQAPNLGHNDGSNLFPSAAGGISNYFPTLQAGARAFLGKALLHAGPWDELSLWMNLDIRHNPPKTANDLLRPDINRLGDNHTWVTLRAANFQNRPAHCDQLHVEIWRNGLNVARDPGTYQYNAAPPWQNALACTRVHNTIAIDGRDQMTLAGKFLWLDWAQSKIFKSKDSNAVSAEHNGYRSLGLVHKRTVRRLGDDHWQIDDEVRAVTKSTKIHSINLHWLLPDWQWELEPNQLFLKSQDIQIRITLKVHTEGIPHQIYLARAGELLACSREPDPLLGWYSPTYGEKEPALSFGLIAKAPAPLVLTTDWVFLKSENRL